MPLLQEEETAGYPSNQDKDLKTCLLMNMQWWLMLPSISKPKKRYCCFTDITESDSGPHGFFLYLCHSYTIYSTETVCVSQITESDELTCS